MAKYWRLSSPDYDSDYRHTYINGSASHPYGLPGIECSGCGSTWGGGRVLPYPCPEEMRGILSRERWPIPDSEHRELQSKVLTLLTEQGYEIERLMPGDSFQPASVTIPSKPTADFLWSSIGGPLVSERIKRGLKQKAFTGAEFCPAVLERVGKRSPRLEPPMPSTGEPEDIIEEVNYLSETDGVGCYYEMVITAESGLPPGTEDASTCSVCGRTTYDDRRRKMTMTDGMWRGQDVFLLNTTLYVLVTDDVKAVLDKLRPTNVKFEDASVEIRSVLSRPARATPANRRSKISWPWRRKGG